MKKIVWYITGHGFGHAVRSVAIANHLSNKCDVLFRTAIPFHFFKEEMRRPYEISYARFDCGCLQSDSISVDIESTLDCYRHLAEENRKRLRIEARWCTENSISGVVSDIVPFAFDVAALCGVPSVAVTNFTWYDIYSEYIHEYPAFKPYLEEILAQYRKADRVIALSPSLPMDYFKAITKVSPVGRTGHPKREFITSHFGINPQQQLALIYIGEFGMDTMEWMQLEMFSDWSFLGIHSLPGSPDNYHIIDKNSISYPDLIASVDCVIGKLGYGVVAECMLHGTPLVYLPRERFSEYPVLAGAVEEWGRSVELSQEEFIEFKWINALERCSGFPARCEVSTNSASECADLLECGI